MVIIKIQVVQSSLAVQSNMWENSLSGTDSIPSLWARQSEATAITGMILYASFFPNRCIAYIHIPFRHTFQYNKTPTVQKKISHLRDLVTVRIINNFRLFGIQNVRTITFCARVRISRIQCELFFKSSVTPNFGVRSLNPV